MTCHPIISGLVALLILCAGRPVVAQERPEVQVGQRVRAWIECSTLATVGPGGEQRGCPDDNHETGTVVRLGDGLVLATADSTAAYPLSSITLLEASGGSTSRWRAGALVGFLGGTALTFAVLNSGSPSSTNVCDPSGNQDAIGGPGTCALIAGVVGGLPGLIVGAIVGSRLRTERWEEVSIGGVALTLLPLGPRPVLTLSLPFH